MGGSYPSAEVQSVYSTAPTDWAMYSFGEYGIIRWLIIFESSKISAGSCDIIGRRGELG